MKFREGQTAEYSKMISEADVYNFADICGDFNPIHIDEKEAEKSAFGKRVVHGALVASFISTVLGMYLPGPQTIYLSQQCNFLKPVFIGDTITAKVEIERIDEKGRATLKTDVYNQNGEQVIQGKARVKIPLESS